MTQNGKPDGAGAGQARSSTPSLAHPLLFQPVNEGQNPPSSNITSWGLILPPKESQNVSAEGRYERMGPAAHEGHLRKTGRTCVIVI